MVLHCGVNCVPCKLYGQCQYYCSSLGPEIWQGGQILGLIGELQLTEALSDQTVVCSGGGGRERWWCYSLLEWVLDSEWCIGKCLLEMIVEWIQRCFVQVGKSLAMQWGTWFPLTPPPLAAPAAWPMLFLRVPQPQIAFEEQGVQHRSWGGNTLFHDSVPDPNHCFAVITKVIALIRWSCWFQWDLP